jgi:NAD(P)-dependent dehydrogenase (short-subunit alcohol dehydrogenase family)
VVIPQLNHRPEKLMYSLKNKIVFITGGSSGIGASRAVQFAQQVAKLLLAAKRTRKQNIRGNDSAYPGRHR